MQEARPAACVFVLHPGRGCRGRLVSGDRAFHRCAPGVAARQQFGPSSTPCYTNQALDETLILDFAIEPMPVATSSTEEELTAEPTGPLAARWARAAEGRSRRSGS